MLFRSNDKDPKRFIKNIPTTINGEVALNNNYELDYTKIDEEAIFDGLYAVCTNLEDDVTDISTIKDFIVKVIHGDTEAGKRTDLGTLGKKLNEKFSEFDVRYYGYNKLSTFIENISGLILEKEGNLYYVKEKERKIDRDEIEKFIIDVVENNKKKIKNIGFILEAIKAKYPNFSFKAEGYNQFSKFLNSFDKISVNGNSIKIKGEN